ncbi:hypothetical protein [Tropicimonas sp. IMCC34011]|uniref:hypothetical protein n=1 Tax=Tropicimonas sp. IMCC34011 TaxID=2248759 RepID=UPI00130058F9|nr:hypothetical protein [Tropicimonas sp. IMCC34011]
MPTFKASATLLAAIALCLSLVYLLLPALPLFTFAQERTAEGLFMARRNALPLAGLAVMLFAARDCDPSHARRAICLAVIVTFGGLAILGLIALVRGTSGWMTLPAIAVELVLAALFVPHLAARSRADPRV